MKRTNTIISWILTIISFSFGMISLPNTFQPRIGGNDYYESDWCPKAFVSDIKLSEGTVSLLYTIQDYDNSQLKAVGITYQGMFDDNGNFEDGYSAIFIESSEQLNESITFKFNIPNVRVFNPYIEDVEGRVYRMGSVSTNRYEIVLARMTILFFCVFVFFIAYWLIYLISENKKVAPEFKYKYWIKMFLYVFAGICATDALTCFLTEQEILHGCLRVLLTAGLIIIVKLPILKINYIEREKQPIDIKINKVLRIIKRIGIILIFLVVLSIISSMLSYKLGHRVYGDKMEYFYISVNNSVSSKKVKCVYIDNRYYVSSDYIATTFGFDKSYIGGVYEPWRFYELFGLITDAILTSKYGESYFDIYVGFSDLDENTPDIRVKGYESYNTILSYADIEQFVSQINGTLEIDIGNRTINIKTA